MEFVKQQNLSDVIVITPAKFFDDRGFFSECWNKARLADQGIEIEFVQDNHSMSFKKGTVRGLHFQSPPHAQAKLVRCGRGRLFDVAVDIRKSSPTYGHWMGEELSFENGKQLFIPAGFLHGFITLEDDTEIVYKCSEFYAPECEGAVRFDDPVINIEWPIDVSDVSISPKDASAPLLREIGHPFE